MKSADWIREYIHKLFDEDLNKREIELRDSKLEFINLPLYKYCYVCEDSARSPTTVDYNIDNFENELLYFRNPSEFNDPFDCFMGFSQSQIMRELLIQEFKRKRQLTPQKQKAIHTLFSDNVDFDFDSIPDDELEQIAENITLFLPKDDPLNDVYTDVFQSAYSQDSNILKRLVTNTMTVRDKQIIVDKLYANSIFIEQLKKSCNPDNLDFILTAAPRDMKIKIENNPDSFLNDYIPGLSGIYNYPQVLNDALGDSNLSFENLDSIKQKLDEISTTALTAGRNIISGHFRVTCLSERMNSSLMWSHYANKHYGFCLEYDFTSTITERRYPDLRMAQLLLFPVKYTENRPLLSKALFNDSSIRNNNLPPDFLENLIFGMLCKSNDWAYEKEWRIFQVLSEKPTMHLPKARKVFLGVNMESNAKNRVIQIARKKHIPIYQMTLRSDKYHFDHYEIK